MCHLHSSNTIKVTKLTNKQKNRTQKQKAINRNGQQDKPDLGTGRKEN